MLKTSVVDLFSPKPTRRFFETRGVFLDVLLKDAFGFALSRNQTADMVKKKKKDRKKDMGFNWQTVCR